jgi:hypothetical protein
MLQTLTFGGITLCGLAILEHLKWVEMSWWPRNQMSWGNAFGPFANRNHTGTIAAITCVLCAANAYDAHRRKSRRWMLFIAGAALPLACIFINTSKAGVVLLFLGLTTWLGTSAMRKGFFQKMAVAVSLIMVIATLLVISGGGVGKRLQSGEFTKTGARSMLVAETLKMVIQSPWLGVGLGNFESVFPLVTEFHEPRARFIHPENDLLWLLAEGGLLTVLPGLLLLLWVFRSSGPWFGKKRKSSQNRQDRKLRNAAAITFGMGAVHGLVDVPNHGLAFAIFMALLAGILVRPRRLRTAAGPVDRLVVRAAGVAVLLVGAGGCFALSTQDDIPVPARYVGLQEKTVGVMVWCDRVIRLDYPTLQLDVASAVQRQLQLAQSKDKKKELKDATFPVQPRSIVRFQVENPDIDTQPITAVAPKLNVDRLIYVEVEEFYTRPDAQLTLFRGTVGGTVRLVEIAEDNTAKVAYVENDVQTVYPKDAPVEGLPGSDDARIYQATVNAFAKEIVHRFVTYVPSDEK